MGIPQIMGQKFDCSLLWVLSETGSLWHICWRPWTLPVPPQVPQDDWGGYPGDGKDDEIPCRRMRSSSYVKAMGDEESGESDSSPKASPQKSVRPDALVKSVIRPRDLLDSQRYITDFECQFFIVAGQEWLLIIIEIFRLDVVKLKIVYCICNKKNPWQ